MNVKDLIETAFHSFTTTTRNNGDEITIRKDDSPEWVAEMVHAAHDERFPNDQTYDAIVKVLGTFVEYDDLDEMRDAIYEIEPDVYNSELLRWVSSDLGNMAYVDEAVETWDYGDLAHALMQGQQLWLQEIAVNVLDFIGNMAEDEPEEEEEEDTAPIDEYITHEHVLYRILESPDGQFSLIVMTNNAPSIGAYGATVETAATYGEILLKLITSSRFNP